MFENTIIAMSKVSVYEFNNYLESSWDGERELKNQEGARQRFSDVNGESFSGCLLKLHLGGPHPQGFRFLCLE